MIVQFLANAALLGGNFLLLLLLETFEAAYAGAGFGLVPLLLCLQGFQLTFETRKGSGVD